MFDGTYSSWFVWGVAGAVLSLVTPSIGFVGAFSFAVTTICLAMLDVNVTRRLHLLRGESLAALAPFESPRHRELMERLAEQQHKDLPRSLRTLIASGKVLAVLLGSLVNLAVSLLSPFGEWQLEVGHSLSPAWTLLPEALRPMVGVGMTALCVLCAFALSATFLLRCESHQRELSEM